MRRPTEKGAASGGRCDVSGVWWFLVRHEMGVLQDGRGLAHVVRSPAPRCLLLTCRRVAPSPVIVGLMLNLEPRVLSRSHAVGSGWCRFRGANVAIHTSFLLMQVASLNGVQSLVASADGRFSLPT